MSCRCSRFLQLPISLSLLIGTASFAQAAGWSDDFNDGNTKDGSPVTWLEDLGGSGFFPGTYDASSGDYVLNPDDSSPTGQMSALVPGPQYTFTDTYMCAREWCCRIRIFQNLTAATWFSLHALTPLHSPVISSISTPAGAFSCRFWNLAVV